MSECTACHRSLWAVFNGYMGNGACAVVVEAEDEASAIAAARQLNLQTKTCYGTVSWAEDRKLKAERFLLGVEIELS